MTKITKAASLLGRKGGKVTSQAKAEAARKNGAKGGAPTVPTKSPTVRE